MKNLISKALTIAKSGTSSSVNGSNHKRQRGGKKVLLTDETTKTCVSETEDSCSSSCSDPHHHQGSKQQQPEDGGWYEDAFFRRELMHVKTHPEITKVTFKDFIDRHQKDDLLALTDIIKQQDGRTWKCIKFQDRIKGDNYRRWQFKKENIRRSLVQTLRDLNLLDKIPVFFDEHLEIDMDDMSRQSIVSLLREVQKDPQVTSIYLDGFIAHTDIESVVGMLITLLKNEKRKWKSVVVKCSFDGDDYYEWSRKINLAQNRLESISAKRSIPIGFQVC